MARAIKNDINCVSSARAIFTSEHHYLSLLNIAADNPVRISGACDLSNRSSILEPVVQIDSNYPVQHDLRNA